MSRDKKERKGKAKSSSYARKKSQLSTQWCMLGRHNLMQIFKFCILLKQNRVHYSNKTPMFFLWKFELKNDFMKPIFRPRLPCETQGEERRGEKERWDGLLLIMLTTGRNQQHRTESRIRKRWAWGKERNVLKHLQHPAFSPRDTFLKCHNWIWNVLQQRQKMMRKKLGKKLFSLFRLVAEFSVRKMKNLQEHQLHITRVSFLSHFICLNSSKVLLYPRQIAKAKGKTWRYCAWGRLRGEVRTRSEFIMHY